MRPIVHLAEPEHWDHAQRDRHDDRSTRGASLADVGYVHCSFAHQVDRVASAVHDDVAAAMSVRLTRGG